MGAKWRNLNAYQDAIKWLNTSKILEHLKTNKQEAKKYSFERMILEVLN
jgi:hypothetical protein